MPDSMARNIEGAASCFYFITRGLNTGIYLELWDISSDCVVNLLWLFAFLSVYRVSCQRSLVYLDLPFLSTITFSLIIRWTSSYSEEKSCLFSSFTSKSIMVAPIEVPS